MTDDYCKYEHDHPEQIPKEAGSIVECLSCPAEWEVLIDDLSGEFELVRTEVTQPESWYQHPLAKGLAGFTALLTALFSPIVGGVYFMQWYIGEVPTETELWAVGYFIGLGAMALSWIVATNLTQRTPVDHWVWLFDRWTDTRYRRKQ